MHTIPLYVFASQEGSTIYSIYMVFPDDYPHYPTLYWLMISSITATFEELLNKKTNINLVPSTSDTFHLVSCTLNEKKDWMSTTASARPLPGRRGSRPSWKNWRRRDRRRRVVVGLVLLVVAASSWGRRDGGLEAVPTRWPHDI